MNRFEKALSRIRRTVTPGDDWTEEDKEHYRTIIDALELQIPQEDKNGKKVAFRTDLN